MENILNKSYINNEHGKLLTSSIAYKQEYYILMVGNFYMRFLRNLNLRSVFWCGHDTSLSLHKTTIAMGC